MDLKNAKQPPQIFFGLHMVPGLCKYPEKNNLMVLLKEEVTKEMDATFPGKPVYVQHVEEVELDTIQADSAGYVIESFFNKWDGMHWSKFIIVSDEGHEAIRKKWRLSNSYGVKSFGAGGEHHAVPYDKEVLMGEYDHLAIVPNPRYEESIILTPEEFKAYNSKKEQELIRLANSNSDKENGSMKFNFFKKSKLDNSKELNLEEISVELPKSKKEKTIMQLVNEMDEMEMNAASSEPKMANEADQVKIGDQVMTVKELMDAYNALNNPQNASEEDPASVESLNNEDDEAAAEKKKAEDAAKAEKMKNDKAAADAAKAEADKKKQENFDKLKNAAADAAAEAHAKAPTILTSDDQVAVGRNRYGS